MCADVEGEVVVTEVAQGSAAAEADVSLSATLCTLFWEGAGL